MKISAKRIWQNSLISITSTIIVLLVFEAGMRISGYQPKKVSIAPPYLFSNHPQTWWTLTPNYNKTIKTRDGNITYKINSQGIRAPGNIEKGARPSLFVIGNSYTFGAGINEEYTFPHLLNTTFKEQSINIQAVNLGVIGFGTCQCYERLLEYTKLLGPPQIVIYLFCPNDPIDNLAGEKQVVWGIRVDENHKHKKILAFIGHCYFNSRLAAFICDRLYDKKYNPRKRRNQELQQSNVPIEQREDYILTQKCLSQLIEWTQERNIHLLVITTNPSCFSQPMSNFLHSNHVPMLKAVEIFNSLNSDSLSIHLAEGHWNQLGHELIARGIFEFIKNEGWL